MPLCDDVRICSIRVKYPFRLTGIMPHTYTKCIHSIFYVTFILLSKKEPS